MPKYLILEFEHDDEFGMFPDDLEIMLEELSNPPYNVKVIGEAVPSAGITSSELFKVVPIDENVGQ